MAQLKLYKGTQTEYDTKKSKIADGGLVLVKDENTSETADLYIKEGANYIKVSDNDAYNNLGYIPETGLLSGKKVKGTTETILTVDSALSTSSKNPVQNQAVENSLAQTRGTVANHSSQITELQGRTTAVENRATSLENWRSVAQPAIGDNTTRLNTLVNVDTGKSVRTIANEELAAQLLSGKADADFKTLQELAAWLENHPEEATAINNELNRLDEDKAETREISQAAYNALSLEEKNNGTIYLIYDAHGFVGMEAQFAALQERVTVLENNKYDTASKVGYIDTATGFNTNNVQGAINALNTKVNSNYNNLNSRIDTALGNIETLLSQI